MAITSLIHVDSKKRTAGYHAKRHVKVINDAIQKCFK